MKYFWGLVLIAIGSGYLASSLGYIDSYQISQIWMWWPLILIFIGFDVIFKRFKYGYLAMIALTFIAALLVYSVSFAPDPLLDLGNSDYNDTAVKESKIEVEGSENLKISEISVDTGAVNFEIGGDTDKLLAGTLTSNFAEANTKVTQQGDTVKTNISTNSFRHQMMWLGGSIKNELRLALSNVVPALIKVNTGASEIDFNLSEYIISGLEVNAGASSIHIRLGEKVINGAVVKIDSGASDISIDLPSELGVSITAETGLTAQDFKGFTKVGDKYQNEAYADASKKIEIELRTGASSITVNQY